MSQHHEHDDEDCFEPNGEACAGDTQVPEGAAVFPFIPADLGIHPLLLATLHAVVFFDGSSEDVVNDPAASEALHYLATYIQRLEGDDLKRIREDMDCLLDYARQEKWPKEEVDFLKGFLGDFGVKTR